MAPRSNKKQLHLLSLPDLAKGRIYDKLESRGQADSATVCREWLRVARGRCKKLRVVLCPRHTRHTRHQPERAVAVSELQGLLQRFDSVSDLRISAANMRVLPQLPPLPQLTSLALEGGELSSLPAGQSFASLKSLTFTVRDCDDFRGSQALQGLPLLQDLDITCLCGDVHAFLSRMPEMVSLRSFALSLCYESVDLSRPTAEATYSWMRSLQQLQLQFLSRFGMYAAVAAKDEVPQAILGSCPCVKQLSLYMPTISSASILRAASLASLRSLRFSGKIESSQNAEVAAAWRLLRPKLTALYLVSNSQILFDIDQNHALGFSRLPSSLQGLHIPVGCTAINSASLAHLVGLRQLSLQPQHLPRISVEGFKALSGLTKLHIGFIGTTMPFWEHIRALEALPRLQELELETHCRDFDEDFHKGPSNLATAICKSGARVKLGVMVGKGDTQSFPHLFVHCIREQLQELCLSFFNVKSVAGTTRGFSSPSSCFYLPLILGKLQLWFRSAQDFFTWIGDFETRGAGNQHELRSVCLLLHSDVSSTAEEQMRSALCLTFPQLVEICVHGDHSCVEVPLCACCAANGFTGPMFGRLL